MATGPPDLVCKPEPIDKQYASLAICEVASAHMFDEWVDGFDQKIACCLQFQSNQFCGHGANT